MDKPKKSNYLLLAWIIWILSAAFMFYKYVIEVSPSVMTTSLMETFHLDGATLGNLAASYYYSYLIMQIPVGLLIDRFGPRRITTVAILFCALGTLIFAKAEVVLVAGIGRFIVGAGAAFAAINCFKLITNWFPHNRFAFMAGLMMTVGMLGAAGGVSPLATIVHKLGWRNSLYDISLIGFGLAILFWFIVRDHPRGIAQAQEQKQIKPLKALLRIFKNPQTWYISIYSGLAFAPVTTFGGLWGVSFIEEAYELDRTTAGHFTSLIFIGFAIGAPLAGILSDWIGRRKPLMMWGTCLSTVFLLLIIYMQNMPLFVLAALLLLMGLSLSSFLICFTVIRELTSKLVVATAIGFMNALDALFGAFSDPLTGLFLDLVWNNTMRNGVSYFTVENYRFALFILPLYLLISLIFLKLTKETHCKEQHSHDFLV